MPNAEISKMKNKVKRKMKNSRVGGMEDTMKKGTRREPRLQHRAVKSSLAEKRKEECEDYREPESGSQDNISQVNDELKIDSSGAEILGEKNKRSEGDSMNGQDQNYLSNMRRTRFNDSIMNDDLNSPHSLLMNGPETDRDLRTIFVGNLPVDFKKKKLARVLKQYGKVEKIWTRGAKPLSALPKKIAVIKNKFHEKHPPLMIHAVFETIPEAHAALELNGELYDGSRLRVTMVREKLFHSGKGVFVGNLPFEIKDDELFDFFLRCGEIANVRVVRDVRTGAGKGFGYVNFKSTDSVELALNLDEEKLNGREIRVRRLLSPGKKKKLEKKKGESTLRTIQQNKGSYPSKRKESVGAAERRLKQKKSKLKPSDYKKKILVQKLLKKSRRNADPS